MSIKSGRLIKYLAPMEGITDHIYRATWMKYYGGADFCMTPFLSPNSNLKFPEREFKHVDPKRNDVSHTIPQLLCNNAEHFIWGMKASKELGYTEVNFNLGCPSGTVTAKKKGSGFLLYLDELDRFLYEIFSAKDVIGMDISIKTRVGYDSADEWGEILDIYNKFDVKYLTVHPRITKDFYNGSPRMETFEYAARKSKNALIYNGDIRTKDDVVRIETMYKDLDTFAGVMIGRGLITNPWLLAGEASIENFRNFFRELYERYREELPGDVPLMHRMKEFLSMWQMSTLFSDDNAQKCIKSAMKAKKRADFENAVKMLGL